MTTQSITLSHNNHLAAIVAAEAVRRLLNADEAAPIGRTDEPLFDKPQGEAHRVTR